MKNTKPKIEFKLPFFLAWIFTFMFLYGLSYLWHGMFLDDLSRVPYSMSSFLLLVAVVYFCIAFGLTFLIQLLPFDIKKHLKGLYIGGVMGVFIYLVAFVFGISFYGNPSLTHILFDLGWQVFEGALGGTFSGTALSFFMHVAKENKKVRAAANRQSVD